MKASCGKKYLVLKPSELRRFINNAQTSTAVMTREDSKFLLLPRLCSDFNRPRLNKKNPRCSSISVLFYVFIVIIKRNSQG